MRLIVPALALLAVFGCQPPKPTYTLLPATTPGGLPLDSKDRQPVLLGVVDREAILAHRDIFRTNLAKVRLSESVKARWRAMDAPVTLVVATASWCGDTQRELPDLLALMAEPSPFVKVHFVGVWRDKAIQQDHWPAGCTPQKVERVPTLWAFALQSGGSQRLLGAIVENPPKKGQPMAEAIVELLERAR